MVFFPFVLLLCTLWELSARLFFNRYSAFTDQKKKNKKKFELLGELVI